MNKWSFISHFQAKMTYLKREEKTLCYSCLNRLIVSPFKHLIAEGWFADMSLKHGICQTTPF